MRYIIVSSIKVGGWHHLDLRPGGETAGECLSSIELSDNKCHKDQKTCETVFECEVPDEELNPLEPKYYKARWKEYRRGNEAAHLGVLIVSRGPIDNEDLHLY